MRDIPSTVPDEIADLIYRNWGDIKRFSEACGLKYTTVHSVLCRNKNHGALEKLSRIAESLGLKPEELADIIETTDKDRLAGLISKAGLNYKELAQRSGVSADYLHGLFNGVIKNSHLRNVRQISMNLGISLTQFRDFYNLPKAS